MIRLDRVPSTAILPLQTRAAYGDTTAQRFFTYLKEKGVVGVTNYNKGFYPAYERAVIFDQMVEDYLKELTPRTILNFGCGFCTRYQRLKACSYLDGVEWINIDFSKDTIALREEYFGNDGQIHIVMDLLKDDLVLPSHDLIVAEGFFAYVSKQKARELIKGRVIFDASTMNRTMSMGDILWKYNKDEWSFKKIYSSVIFDNHNDHNAPGNMREAVVLDVVG